MPTPTIFEGINPRGTQNFIPCKDKAAVDWSSYAKTGVHNLLTPNYKKDNSTTFTTVTWNDDGTVKVSGSNTVANANISFKDRNSSNFTLPNGNYILRVNIDKTYIGSITVLLNNTVSGSSHQIISGNVNTDYPFTVDDNTGAMGLNLIFGNGAGLDNVTFSPLIRLATDTDTTYAPHAQTNKELTDSKISWEENAKTGVHNINGTKYVSDSFFTANSDGSVTVNVGTAQAGNITDGLDANSGFIAPFDAQVKLTGGISAGCHVFAYDMTASARPYTDSSKTSRIDTSNNQYGSTPQSFYMEKGHKYTMIVRVMAGTTVSNQTMYPLLTLQEDTNTNYSSPAMTNQQLTDKVSFISTDGKGVDSTAALIEYIKTLNFLNTYKIRFEGNVMNGITGNTYRGFGVVARANENVFDVFLSEASTPDLYKVRGTISGDSISWSAKYKFTGTAI